MSEWLILNEPELEKVDPGESRQVKGVLVHVFMSPYDVPQAVRGRYDDERERFLIEFRYIGDEPIERREQDRHLALHVGKNSGRLYGVEIDVDTLRADLVALEMHIDQSHLFKSLSKAASSASGRPTEKNYRAVRNVISLKKDRLFAGLAG